SETVAPSVLSFAGLVKSATTTVSLEPNIPFAISEPMGPTPSARITMNPSTSVANAPTAIAPPSQVRRHDMCGLALMARPAIVPRDVVDVPPGVKAGVVVNARYAVRWTYAVRKIIGRPRSITPAEPGSTQSGRP